MSIACVKCTKGKLRRVRGLCNYCYQLSLEAVNAGKTTWAEEERAGRSIAPDKEAKKRWHYGRNYKDFGEE